MSSKLASCVCVCVCVCVFFSLSPWAASQTWNKKNQKKNANKNRCLSANQRSERRGGIYSEREIIWGGIFSSKCPRRYQSLSTLLEFFAVFLSPHCAWNVPLHLVFFIRVKNGEDWICNAARTAAGIMTGLDSPVHSACLLLSSHIGWRWFLWHWLFCQKRVLSAPPPPARV